MVEPPIVQRTNVSDTVPHVRTAWRMEGRGVDSALTLSPALARRIHLVRGLRTRHRRALQLTVPVVLLRECLRPGRTARRRIAAALGLVGIWTRTYAKYRRWAITETQRERELLAVTSDEAFKRHYNDDVPTIEEEFDLWGEYHEHRHEMRYDLVANEVLRRLPPGGTVLDIGCGSALVADRLRHETAHYVGVDFGAHHVSYARRRLPVDAPLRVSIGRCDGEALPFRDHVFDVIVMSEVIEHLLRPERAVWEVARVLKPGGAFIMTTNNASEVPLHSPLTHLFVWIERAVGSVVPSIVSRRPWVWPEPVNPRSLETGSPPMFVPHTHHIQGETRRLFAAAGLETLRWGSFEFPPPQSAMARWLEQRGAPGRAVVDLIEAAAQRVPVLRLMGAHLLMVAEKRSARTLPTPPPGIWPGPLSS